MLIRSPHRAGDLRVFLLASSAHDRNDRGRSGDGQRCALMLDQCRSSRGSTASWTGTDDDSRSQIPTRIERGGFATPRCPSRRCLYAGKLPFAQPHRRRRRRSRVLPTGAAPFRQLPRPGDETLAANDSAKRLQCGVRPARQTGGAGRSNADEEAAEAAPLWHEPQASPEVSDAAVSMTAPRIRRLVAALPQPFREAIVLREINELSYQEIAQVAGVPVGTVMSRLARARSMLRSAWNVAKERRHELRRM